MAPSKSRLSHASNRKFRCSPRLSGAPSTPPANTESSTFLRSAVSARPATTVVWYELRSESSRTAIRSGRGPGNGLRHFSADVRARLIAHRIIRLSLLSPSATIGKHPAWRILSAMMFGQAREPPSRRALWVGVIALVSTILVTGAMVASRARKEARSEELQILQGIRKVCKLSTVELSIADYARKSVPKASTFPSRASPKRICSTPGSCRRGSTSVTMRPGSSSTTPPVRCGSRCHRRASCPSTSFVSKPSTRSPVS